MIKLLQKYKMYILVVAGVLIMGSFLLAEPLRQWGQYTAGNERAYTIDGQKISKSDLQDAAIHLDGLKRAIHPDLLKRQFRMDDDATQWQLAATAAEKAGLVGGPADGRATARSLIVEQMRQEARNKGSNDWRAYYKSASNVTDEGLEQRIDQLADLSLTRAGRTGDAAAEGANAFAEYHGLVRLMQSYQQVPQTSENRLAQEARNILDVAVLKYVFVPITEARIAAAPAPTPEEMQAQFDKFKDTPVGTGEYGAGYRQNDRITYTWFAVDRAAVSKAVTIDPIEVSKRVVSRTTGDKVDPALRGKIEDEIRDEMTKRAMEEFTTALRAEFLRSSALLADKDGYKTLPADWKKPDMAAVVAGAVQRVAADNKGTIPLPVINTVSVPQDARAFITEKGIGTTMIRSGQQALPLRDILFNAKEFGKPAGKIPAQVGVPIPTAFTSVYDSNLYFVMLDSAIPSASPKSLDEARAMVEKDLRKIKALGILKSDIEAGIAPVVTLGMSQAPGQLAVLGYPGLTVQNAETRRGGYILDLQRYGGQRIPYQIEASPNVPAPREVQDPTFAEAAVSRAEKLDPSMHIAADTAPDRTFVHSLASGDGVVLAQVVGLKPVTLETFREIAGEPDFQRIVESKEIGKDTAPPFKTDVLIKRLNVTGLDRTKKNDEEN